MFGGDSDGIGRLGAEPLSPPFQNPIIAKGGREHRFKPSPRNDSRLLIVKVEKLD